MPYFFTPWPTKTFGKLSFFEVPEVSNRPMHVQLNIFSSKFHWDLFSISVDHVILVFDFGITRIFLSSMKTIFSSWMEGLWSLADAFSRLHSFSRWLRLWHRSFFGSRISLFSPRGSVFVSRWVSSSRHVDLQLQKPEKYYQYQCHEYKV